MTEESIAKSEAFFRESLAKQQEFAKSLDPDPDTEIGFVQNILSTMGQNMTQLTLTVLSQQRAILILRDMIMES